MSRAATLALEAAPPHLGDVLDFMRVIWGLDHALQKASKRMKSAIGVTGPQRLAIRLIARFPGIPAGQLAELLQVHPSTLTGILKRLERQGLVRRRPDPKDGRRAFLGITEKGRSIDAATTGTVEAAVQVIIARVPKMKLDHARQILMALTESLEAGGARTGPRRHLVGKARPYKARP
jgi:MarR family transcriptional regulator, organic hydroperoxide resistance regulator